MQLQCADRIANSADRDQLSLRSSLVLGLQILLTPVCPNTLSFELDRTYLKSGKINLPFLFAGAVQVLAGELKSRKSLMKYS